MDAVLISPFETLQTDFRRTPLPIDSFWHSLQAGGIPEALVHERMQAWEVIMQQSFQDVAAVLREYFRDSQDSDQYHEALRNLNSIQANMVVDPMMPRNIGGYLDPESWKLAINPLQMLYADPADLYHILVHELWHAVDVFSQEEAMVDSLTVKMKSVRYPDAEIEMGYVSLVAEIEGLFCDKSPVELLTFISEDPGITLANIFVEGFMQDVEVAYLTREGFAMLVASNWERIRRLFPRLINDFTRVYAGLHDKVTSGPAELADKMYGYVVDKLQVMRVEISEVES